jgi:RNA polymerase-binding transcription factor DksA
VSLIDAALRKLEEGAFGVCEACGAPIPRARLELLPFTPVCVNCKASEELAALVENRQRLDEAVPADWDDLAMGCDEEAGIVTLKGNKRPK